MQRREVDPISVVVGALLLVVALADLLGAASTGSVGRWVWPVGLILLGGIGLAATARRQLPARDRDRDRSRDMLEEDGTEALHD